jgi:putative DNA primase/helicase
MAATVQLTQDKLANFPAELRALPQWVTWNYETRGDKRTKVPYCPRTHRRASSTSSSTWADYETAISASSTPGYSGVGFMFAPPYVGIDLDHCRDIATGAVEPWAAAIISELNSYTEVSPSGTGLHCIINGTIPPGGNRRGRCEMYSAGRYFTVTGDHVVGTPLTVEARDLSALHACMLANTLEAIPAAEGKVIPFERCDKPSRDDLMAGLWQGLYTSQSDADFALCGMLAEDFAGDAEKIDAAVRASALYRAKWNERRGNTTYGAQTIGNAVKLWREKGAICVVEEEETPVSTIPIYPTEALTGDYLGDLTAMLSDGTSIPPQFVRENIKCLVGAVIDGHAGFPGQEDLHTRLYTVNISLHPRTGKYQAWRRTGEFPNGLLNGMLADHGVKDLDGGRFGSGEIMTKALCDLEQSGCPSHVLARFDEMYEPFDKAKATGSTLESKLLQLYERNAIASGSFKNGQFEVKDTHFSLCGDFTRDKFQQTFEGRGSGSSGFLARCTLAFADKVLHTGDWAALDNIAAVHLVTQIECCADTVRQLGGRFVPEEADEARAMRWEFFEFLRKSDPRYSPELEAHFKRDLLFRALFSKDGQIDELRVRKSIAWTLHQLELRNELWPEDAGGPVERMEQKIVKVLTAKGTLSLSRLIDFCHVKRPGSGGHETFNRSLKALIATRQVVMTGKTQRGAPVYSLGDK